MPNDTATAAMRAASISRSAAITPAATIVSPSAMITNSPMRSEKGLGTRSQARGALGAVAGHQFPGGGYRAPEAGSPGAGQRACVVQDQRHDPDGDARVALDQ